MELALAATEQEVSGVAKDCTIGSNQVNCVTEEIGLAYVDAFCPARLRRISGTLYSHSPFTLRLETKDLN